MPSLILDLLPALFKRKHYNDLSDYDRGWVDGTVHLAIIGGITAIMVFGGYKCPRWVDNTPLSLVRLADTIMLLGKCITLWFMKLYV